jgi:hypothetical protein
MAATYEPIMATRAAVSVRVGSEFDGLQRCIMQHRNIVMGIGHHVYGVRDVNVNHPAIGRRVVMCDSKCGPAAGTASPPWPPPDALRSASGRLRWGSISRGAVSA